MDGNEKSFIKDRRVHQMSAAKQNVSSSDSCDEYEWSDGLHTLDAINQLSKPKNMTNMIWVAPRVAGQYLKMEVDTGSAYSVIPLSVYKELFQKQELQRTSVTLQTYMGELVVQLANCASRCSTNTRRRNWICTSLKVAEECCLVVTGCGK